MYERVKKKYYLVKNIENPSLAAIFSVPTFYHKFIYLQAKVQFINIVIQPGWAYRTH